MYISITIYSHTKRHIAAPLKENTQKNRRFGICHNMSTGYKLFFDEATF